MSESNFEWNENKNLENQQKHGISFEQAQYAFYDGILHIARTRIAIFASAWIKMEAVSLPFDSPIEKIKSVSSERDIGGKVRKLMSRQIQYTDEPIGDFKVVADFLPSPDELRLKNENTKITISLSKESVDFFKQAAAKNHMQYQKMIRQLLNEYVAHQKSANN